MTVYQLTFSVGHKVHTRWLVSYHTDDAGALHGINVRGKKREVGSSTPYSVAERDELPADVEYEPEVVESYEKAENAVGDA